MYNIGDTFRGQLDNDNRAYAVQLYFTFTDNSTLTVTNSGIWEGGLSFEDATSDNEFEIGSAIVNKMNVTLNNIYDTYSAYDFDGAVVVVNIGININGSPSEYFRRGTYIVQNSDGYNTSLIRLECYDYMTKFDKEYLYVSTNYPATLRTIVQHICSYCGVTLLNSNFTNADYVVSARPDDEGLTCRQMIAFVAQIACCFARCDNYGRLQLKWYDMDSDPVHSFTGIYNVSTGLAPIVITGIKVIEEFAEDEHHKKGTYLYGNEGYVLEVSGNDLIQMGYAQAAAEAIGQIAVNAIPFYKVSATILSDPSVEVGDVAEITDNKGNTVMFPITRVTFSSDNSMTVECSAKDAIRQTAKQFSELTRALVKAKQNTQAQLTDYDLAVQTLTELMSEAFGVFKTEQVQQDGSIVYILHNKPTLEGSQVQWKMTANGLAVSNDYGATWVAGIDSSGNAVVNVLNAIGVSADWIRTGELEVGDAFYANVTTGQVRISGDNVYIGNTPVSIAFEQLSGALTIVLSNEIQGIPVDADGNYTTFPSGVTTTVRVVYGSVDVTNDCTITLDPVCITGTWNSTTHTYTATSLTADTGYCSFIAEYTNVGETLRTAKRFDLYKVRSGAQGPEGEDGTPARMYYIEPDTTVMKLVGDDAFMPTSVTFKAYYRDGDEETRHEYEGLFRVEISTDGRTWETVEYPVQNKTQTTFTPDDDRIVSIRCTLYSTAVFDTIREALATNTSGDEPLADIDESLLESETIQSILSGGDVLDVQSVAVVADAASLTQQEVFDILTNGSINEGVYLHNGRLYINATMIKSGHLSISDRNGRETLYVDTATGTVRICATSFSLTSGDTIESIAEEIADEKANEAEVTAKGYTDVAIAGQTQMDIYNKLTNNDTNSGLYIENGALYMRANMIKTGTLLADRIGANSITVDKITANNLVGTNGWINLHDGTFNYGSGKLTWNGTTLSVTGTINSTVGNIGGWEIDGNYIKKSVTINGTIYQAYMYAPSSLQTPRYGSCFGLRISTNNGSSWTYPFNVLYDGQLTATNAVITGNVTATSLTASSYIYVNGNSDSYFKIPIAQYYDLTSGEYLELSGEGFKVKTRECDVQIGGLWGYGDIASSSDVLNGMALSSSLAGMQITSAKLHIAHSTNQRYQSIITYGKVETYNLYAVNNCVIHGDCTIDGDCTVTGRKPRLVETEDYGKRYLYAYETPSPLFGDVGEGIINSDGLCYIRIDPTFAQTITTTQYQVFLQAYGDGRCYVQERHSAYFIVAGTPGMAFGWEMKAKQSDFDQLRLERYYEKPETDEPEEPDYIGMALEHLKQIREERTNAA